MINRLDWDSNFFGVETGKLVVEENQIIDDANFNYFDFVSIFSNHKLSKEQLNINNGNIQLVDQKVVYRKFLKESSDISTDIHSFKKNRFIPEQLYELAFQSGHYSRFSIDPNISRSFFERLYKIWLERSVSRDIADEVFVYETDDLVRGFITLGIKSGRPDIGLVAVNTEGRSLGIGALLLNAAENWAIKKAQINEIQVVTQGQNQGACRFYEKNGYTIDSITYVYHWWNK